MCGAKTLNLIEKAPNVFNMRGVALKIFLLSPKAMEDAGRKFLNSLVTPREQANDSNITRYRY